MKKNRFLAFFLALLLAVTSFSIPVQAKQKFVFYMPMAVPTVKEAEKHSYRSKMTLSDNYSSVKTKKVNFYYITPDNVKKQKVYFFNGNKSVPYLELSKLFELYDYASELNSDKNLQVDFGYGKKKFYAYRENGAKVVFDFGNQSIIFDDYDLFLSHSYVVSGGDICDKEKWQLNKDGTVKTDEEGNALVKLIYASEGDTSGFERSGYAVSASLGEHNISFYIKDGKAFMPIATFSDLFLAPWNIGYIYNGENVFLSKLSGLDEAVKNDEGKTTKDLFYNIKNTKRTKELAEFTYNELTLILDMHYGLAEEHGIHSFDKYLDSIGLKQRLLSTDATEFDHALKELLEYYIGDQHSAFNVAGPYDTSGNDDDLFSLISSDKSSPTSSKVSTDEEKFSECRMKVEGILSKKEDENGNPIPVPYMEIGDTAYITFDSFQMLYYDNTERYYSEEFKKNVKKYISTDTIALVYYANKQINRKKSPIKNIVIDLSLNGGGVAESAVFILGWLLRKCQISTVNPITGAQYTVNYLVDVNLDGHIGNEDYLENYLGEKYSIFCLTSPNSFSCGNLVPSVLQELGYATIIGKPSGGGACVVEFAATADGSFYQFSGKIKLCKFKNGSYYSIDTGVIPDFTLSKLDHFYDREWLTEYINSLP